MAFSLDPISRLIDGQVLYASYLDEVADAVETTATALTGVEADVQSARIVADEASGGDDASMLQTAINDAISDGVELVIPSNGANHLIGSGLVWNSGVVRFRGLGLGSTIEATTTGFDMLTVGPGAGGSGSNPSGWIKDFRLLGGDSTPAADGFRALCLDGIRQVTVENVTTLNTDIGFDLINNCFGVQFINCRAGFGATHNVAFNVREGPQSGNDLLFINCWGSSLVAGLHISPESNNIRWIGGQLNCAAAATTDTYGVVTIGKDYTTGTTGGAGFVQIETDIEGSRRCWAIRSFGGVQLDVRRTSFFANNNSNSMIGIIKMTAAVAGKLSLEDNVLTGHYTDANLWSIDDSSSTTFFVFEKGWQVGATAVAGASDTKTGGTSIAGTFRALQQHAPAVKPDKGIAMYGTSSVARILMGSEGFLTTFGLTTTAGTAASAATATGLVSVRGRTTGQYSTNNTDGVERFMVLTSAPVVKTAGWTWALLECSKTVNYNSASGGVATVPTNAAIALPVGTTMIGYQTGAGALTITGATGVTVNGTSAGSSVSPGIRSRYTAYQQAANDWIVTWDTPAG